MSWISGHYERKGSIFYGKRIYFEDKLELEDAYSDIVACICSELFGASAVEITGREPAISGLGTVWRALTAHGSGQDLYRYFKSQVPASQHVPQALRAIYHEHAMFLEMWEHIRTFQYSTGTHSRSKIVRLIIPASFRLIAVGRASAEFDGAILEHITKPEKATLYLLEAKSGGGSNHRKAAGELQKKLSAISRPCQFVQISRAAYARITLTGKP